MKNGVKYLIADPSLPDKEDFTHNDVMDIQNFSDFVTQRDKAISELLEHSILPNGQTLRMPIAGEKYDEYIAMIDGRSIEQQKQSTEKKPTRLEQLETEQQSLIHTYHDRNKTLEQVKEQSRGMNSYEKSE